MLIIRVFTKVLIERLTPVARRVIGGNQSGFIKGRNILEGVVVLHEVLHSLGKGKRKGMIFKIDFEKAYNRVRWDFLEEVMLGKIFPKQWVDWVIVDGSYLPKLTVNLDQRNA